MMDFIANEMNERDLNDIIRDTLPSNITQDDKSIYDKAYTTLRALTERQIVTNCSQMKKLLGKFNKLLAKKFNDKFTASQKG